MLPVSSARANFFFAIQLAQEFGRGLTLEARYTDTLSTFVTTRCRFILSHLVADKWYSPKVTIALCEQMRRTNDQLAIEHKRWRWTEKHLNR